MATATSTSSPPPTTQGRTTPIPETRILLRGVGWDIYETLVQRIEEQGQAVRLTYDRGDLELMSPSYDHEHFKKLLGRLVETVTQELRIPCASAGSTTWRKQVEDRGLEPDDCFYITSLPRVLGRRLDLSVDPPPDLAIEVEISRSALDRMGIYAALGVPEVWRFDGESLHVHLLQEDRTYAASPTSRELPFLRPEEVETWVAAVGPMGDQSDWGRRLQDWARAELMPRLRGQKP